MAIVLEVPIKVELEIKKVVLTAWLDPDAGRVQVNAVCWDRIGRSVPSPLPGRLLPPENAKAVLGTVAAPGETLAELLERAIRPQLPMLGLIVP